MPWQPGGGAGRARRTGHVEASGEQMGVLDFALSFHKEGQANPDTTDPSFAKTFSIDGKGVNAVNEFRQDDLVTKIAVDWSGQIKVTASLSSRRVTIS